MGGGKTMRLLSILLLLSGLGMADSLAMRDGRIIVGSYLGGDARSVRVAIGDRVESFRVEDISNITFGDQGAPPPPEPPPPAQQQFTPAPAPCSCSSSRGGVRAYASARHDSDRARSIDSIDSSRDYVGKTYHASLDEPVNDANGNTLIPRGADVVVKLVDDKQAGQAGGANRADA